MAAIPHPGKPNPQRTAVPKVEGIVDAKVRHLVEYFKEQIGLGDDDFIVKRLRRDCLFSVRMSIGKDRAKAVRKNRELPLFG